MPVGTVRRCWLCIHGHYRQTKEMYERALVFCKRSIALPPRPSFNFRHLKKGIQEFRYIYIGIC